MTTLNTNILNQIFDATKEINGLEVLISLMNNEDNEKKIIFHLNTLLQTAMTRKMAFSYINELFPYMSFNILKENATIWLNRCLELKIAFNKVHFSLISNLLKNMDQQQEFRKYIVTNGLQKIVDKCLVTNNFTDNLICLGVCLEIYGSTCLPYKDKIQEYLLEILYNNSNLEMVKESGCCFHYLQQVGGGGVDGIYHKTNWSNNFKKLCVTIHAQYDVLFENITEYNDYDVIEMEPFQFPEIDSTMNTTQMQIVITNRVVNLIVFLKAFLETKYPVAKIVSPLIVIDVIKRGFMVHNCISEDIFSANDFTLRELILKIHVKLMYLFRSFIACLQDNSIPYSTLITKLLMDTLILTKKCKCFQLNSTYYVTLYKVFNYWIQLAKNKIDTLCHHKLISFITDEIKPEKHCVKLTIKTVNKKKPTKRKMNGTTIDALSESSTKFQNNSFTVMREIRCTNALKLLDNLFCHVSLCIGQEKILELYNNIIENLLNIQGGIKECPYTSIKCEEQLYNVLVSLFEQPHTIFCPPFEISLGILLIGQKSKNRNISLICSKGISTLEKISQPIYPTLYITTEHKNKPITTVSLKENNVNTTNVRETASKYTQSDEWNDDNKHKSININDIGKIDEKLNESMQDTNLIDDSENKKLKQQKIIENICAKTNSINNENISAHPSKATIIVQNKVATPTEEMPENNSNLNTNPPILDELDDDMLSSFNDVLAES